MKYVSITVLFTTHLIAITVFFYNFSQEKMKEILLRKKSIAIL
jgi:hypothetical protein